ncbi:MAG: hypothetical protein HC898_08770 [Phycisphaerales bacterium]|nr:hypothetical protein [Phycisphaerales bacterium]
MIQSDNHPKHQTVTKTNGETSGQQGSLIRILDLDGMRLELLMDQDHWLGIGQVQTASGISLRSAEMPMTVELRSPDGVRLVNWRLSGISPRQAGGLDLELVCDRIDDGPMEFMLHTVRSRYRVGNGKRETIPAIGTKMILSLWPVQRKLGERVCKGFGYQYQYQSADIAQYKLLDLSTWEPGGSVTGSELWLRGAQPTVTRFNNVADSYSSEWYLPGISNPNVFQFKPLQTHLQGFTFTAGRQGVLITWATQVHHVRTLIQKNPGQDLLLHLHEHCADLGLTLSSAPMEVLFWEQAGLEDVDRANCHEAMRELVYAHLHQQAGMRMERIGPTGMIEEWGPPDMKRYREEGLPALLEAGGKDD